MSRGVVLSALAGALLLVAVGMASGREDDEPAIYLPSTRSVLYEVEGSVKYATVTMQTPTGTRQEDPDVPMHTTDGETGLTFTFPSGAFVYISAQKPGEYGTITCRITVDGVVISVNTSTADYGIASCSGRTW